MSITLSSCLATDTAIEFLNYLNSRHDNIQFTMYMNTTKKFISRIFQSTAVITIPSQHPFTAKKTFTGLYTKWDSFTPRKYKYLKIIFRNTNQRSANFACILLSWMPVALHFSSRRLIPFQISPIFTQARNWCGVKNFYFFCFCVSGVFFECGRAKLAFPILPQGR